MKSLDEVSGGKIHPSHNSPQHFPLLKFHPPANVSFSKTYISKFLCKFFFKKKNFHKTPNMFSKLNSVPLFCWSGGQS